MKYIVFKRYFALFFVLWGASPFSQESIVDSPENRYLYSIDLNKATGDHRLYVELIAPRMSEQSVEFHFPKIVPGTYAIYNFGRFISDLRAFDSNENTIDVEKLDTNRWKISNAGKLQKVTFWVSDTYHSNDKPAVFEPVGSCIDSGKVFVINNFCFFGYFKGYKEVPFTVSVTKPYGFYGATSLPLVQSAENNDVYFAKNYFELHDNPILYTLPDTASMIINNTKLTLSVYSPNNKVDASYLITRAGELFEAQGKYLGGTLPADKYSVLVYMFTGPSKSGLSGALEHFKSTTVSFPEIPNENFIEPFKDIVAHEFFHIITPLGIHSKEVHNFDFINPKMSKHLWLYEGSTEYYAHHAQVKFGITSPEQFLKKMQQKIFFSSLYYNDTLPFTELSKGALDIYKDQYINVYAKGALISMCLDLYLLKLSGGKYGLQNLKSELSQIYGPDKPFEDDELFDVITRLTFPEIRDFFRKYVEGNQRLPYREFLGYAGYDFYEKMEREVPAMLGASVVSDSAGRLVVDGLREFGQELKLKPGDIIQSVNGTELSIINYYRFADTFNTAVKDGDEVTIVVLRKNKKGELKKKTLKASTFMVKITDQFVIVPAKNPSAQQLEIRKAWLNLQ
jgi:predicted metalloprotease with PDZ domain